MRMEASLQARQEMQMRLAPQIIQSLEMLQLPLLELREKVDQELLENPLLEMVPASEEEGAEGEGEELGASAVEAPREEPVQEAVADETDQGEQFERLYDLAEDYAESEGGRSYRSYLSEDRDAKQEAFENSPAPDPTLQEHLAGQLAYCDLDKTIREICRNIIANLDSHGYLAYPLEEILASMDIKVTDEQAAEALRIVQGLEPLGVGARNLQECLILQLDKREADYEFLRALISEHFDDLLQNRYPKVARQMGCTVAELKAAVEKVGRLNPSPGSLFTKAPAPHVIPDLRVEEVDGEYVVLVEDSWLPSLRISPYYVQRLRSKGLDPGVRDYLRKKLQSAQGLISAIEQRRSTIYNVATEIVKTQKEFFEKGSMHLKPLKMQEVADRVGVHVSTVSRAVSDKYVQTPHGIYSLKHPFTGGLQKADGELESWEVVRQKLLTVVAGEDKKKPLSDQEMAESLRKDGVDIARRTVSKYRKVLKIPSSRLRKKY